MIAAKKRKCGRATSQVLWPCHPTFQTIAFFLVIILYPNQWWQLRRLRQGTPRGCWLSCRTLLSVTRGGEGLGGSNRVARNRSMSVALGSDSNRIRSYKATFYFCNFFWKWNASPLSRLEIQSRCVYWFADTQSRTIILWRVHTLWAEKTELQVRLFTLCPVQIASIFMRCFSWERGSNSERRILDNELCCWRNVDRSTDLVIDYYIEVANAFDIDTSW